MIWYIKPSEQIGYRLLKHISTATKQIQEHMKTHKDGYEDSVEGDLLEDTKRNSDTPSEQWNF